MPRERLKQEIESTQPIRPAMTPEARENQLINLATNLAEKQLREGTASSQVIIHYLKQATLKAQIELERIKMENKLIEAKIASLKANELSKEMYERLLKVFSKYSGNLNQEENYDDEIF